MRVGTLTLPLHVNYGAVLQAFALHKALESAGHQPILLDIRSSIYKKNDFLSFLSFFKTSLVKLKRKESEYGNVSFGHFIEKNLNKTPKIRFKYQLNNLSKKEAYIVGSDQVWRSEYALNIELFYFDFVKQDSVKLSYAASFGKKEWSYSPTQTENCSRLLKEFAAISVREKSGKELVKSKLDCEATHVLDPTMIISLNEYNRLIEDKADKLYGVGDVFCYVLDLNIAKQELISSFCSKKRLNEVICNKGKSDKNKTSIENWLQGIRDSEFVITDSFHGMVFCILFEKEFLVLANNGRGYDRFTSLLGQLGIIERLIDESLIDGFSFESLQKIDYQKVNFELNKMKILSLSFLKENLL